jgi:hypothetical protein
MPRGQSDGPSKGRRHYLLSYSLPTCYGSTLILTLTLSLALTLTLILTLTLSLTLTLTLTPSLTLPSRKQAPFFYNTRTQQGTWVEPAEAVTS